MAHSDNHTTFHPHSHADRMIKICGMREPANIRLVASLAPMLMGFIFYDKSPRSAIGLEPRAVKDLPSYVTPVAVFVDADQQTVIDTCLLYGIDTVQLHGSESPQYCRDLKARGLTVLKAFGICDDDNGTPSPEWERMAPYLDVASMFVFDTKTPRHGGSGKQYDWSVLDTYPYDLPYLISGGVAPGDEPRVLAAMRPAMAGIDLNSRFETEPGIKDPIRLATFIAKLRNFNENEPSTTPFWKK